MFLQRKRIYKVLLWTLVYCIVFIAVSNIYVNIFSSGFLFKDTFSIPQNQYGLILGTSQYTLEGAQNQFFHFRMQAAAQLFFDGKIKQIICSGDNVSDKYYNEPKAMSKELHLLGVPDSVIWLDKEGISTRQSVKNFIRNYNINSVTIITQKFHNQRAVFIARKSGLDAVGYLANDVPFFSDAYTHIREWFAKFKEVCINLST